MGAELEQALQLLDQGAAIIQELVAQIQSPKGDMSKKAELLASKTGLSFSDAQEMIKKASENGNSIDTVIALAETMFNHSAFGKVAGEDGIQKTGSLATDRFNERASELLAELEL